MLALAVLLQGVPSVQADVTWADMPKASVITDEAATPCHSERDIQQPGPATSSRDSFACCATLACGMLAQALPPDPIPAATSFTDGFFRPAATRSIALAEPDPAWRPPTRFL